MRARVVALALVPLVTGCSSTSPELTLDILLPAKRQLFAAVTKLDLTARRDGAVLSHATFAASTAAVSLEGVSHGERTIVELDGMDSTGTVIAQGRTCAFTFAGPDTKAPLYFAPTSFFAPTAEAPASARTSPVAMALSDGQVLVAGGADAGGVAFASTELFTPGAATFGASAAVMNHARRRAEGTPIASLGLLVTGGLDAANVTVADAEVYLETTKQFVAVKAPLLDARVGHRAVLLPDGRTFVSGGAATEDGAALATTVFIYVTTEGNSSVTKGGVLAEARRDHAATVAVGIPLLFGGTGAAGAPLDSIEAVDPASGSGAIIAHLQTARTGASASLLADGSILVVGGRDAQAKPINKAELYNPITRTTTSTDLGEGRYGHSATVLADGRVLVAGGFGANGVPLASAELFVPGLGFVSERDLGTARAAHVTVLLCDGTALVVGGAADAELYSGPAN